MGVDLWEVEYKLVLGNLSDEELSFIEKYFPRTEEVIYCLKSDDSPDSLNNVIEKAKATGEFPEAKLSELTAKLRACLMKTDMTLNLSIG